MIPREEEPTRFLKVAEATPGVDIAMGITGIGARPLRSNAQMVALLIDRRPPLRAEEQPNEQGRLLRGSGQARRKDVGRVRTSLGRECTNVLRILKEPLEL